MPPLPPDVTAVIQQLAAPLEPSARPTFQEAVSQKLAALPIAGAGNAHVLGRQVQRDFRTNPSPDLRAGRIGPRGPRNA